MRYLIVLTILVVSCTIIPEDALDYVPSSGRIKSFTILASDDEGPVPESAAGSVTYQGPFDEPTKIEVTWPAGNTLMRVPIFDKTSSIVKTIYELDNFRVNKITNINSRNQVARVETFTYTGKKIKSHILTNFFDGAEAYTFTNSFFYAGDAIDSVHQQVCFADDSCWDGLFVALDKRGGDVTLLDGCLSGTRLNRNANYFSVMPYTRQAPYAFSESYYEHWDPQTQTYYYSMNDLEKSHYSIDPTGSMLSDFSKVNVYTNDANPREDCEGIVFDTELDGYYDPYQSFFGYTRSGTVFWATSYDQHFRPLYYYLLQRPITDNEVWGNNNALIPHAPFLVALTRKVDLLYYMEQESFEPVGGSHIQINYEFEIPNE